ncbi:MAG: Co2+/Mg2+ efflux protein ApaG [Pseudomonadota bacterium]|jgi:ApaG protein
MDTIASSMKALFPYAAETRGLVVRVSVNFLPEQSDPGRGRWFWAYHIRIENEGDMAVQLLSRRWLIRDARGAEHRVEGEGVVGDQPVLKPGGSYDYVSGCPLGTSSGSMAGSYQMIGEDGSRFDIAVPGFALKAPVTTR